jgi:hypothetical protein
MNGACSKNGGEVECIQDLCGKARGKVTLGSSYCNAVNFRD